MSSEDKVIRSLEQVESQLAELRKCLTGDKIKGEQGILDILEMHRKELYGDSATQTVGLKDLWYRDHQKINELRMDRIRLIAYTTGISTAVSIGWIVLLAILKFPK